MPHRFRIGRWVDNKEKSETHSVSGYATDGVELSRKNRECHSAGDARQPLLRKRNVKKDLQEGRREAVERWVTALWV